MYRVDIVNAGGHSFRAKSKDYEFLIDTQGNGITPLDALLASLGTCIGVYLRKYAEGSGLALPEFRIGVQAELSKEKPVCFRKIEVEIGLNNAVIEERRLKAIKEFIKNCPVHHTLKQAPEIVIKLD